MARLLGLRMELRQPAYHHAPLYFCLLHRRCSCPIHFPRSSNRGPHANPSLPCHLCPFPTHFLPQQTLRLPAFHFQPPFKSRVHYLCFHGPTTTPSAALLSIIPSKNAAEILVCIKSFFPY